VESDVVVPVEVVSDKAEYAARTIRPKIHRHLATYLVALKQAKVQHPSLGPKVRGIELDDTEGILRKLSLDRSVPPVSDWFKGGTSRAIKRFDGFIRNRLKYYDQHSNQPQTDDISHMSPYLHFGQISPLQLALKIIRAPDSLGTAKDAFIEQVVAMTPINAFRAGPKRPWPIIDRINGSTYTASRNLKMLAPTTLTGMPACWR
jgi:deoxyribodipyrimidine photo-lyase